MKRKVAVIIGAGPAGLTCAHELLSRTNIVPIVIEQSTFAGGLATTIDFKGNRMDLGGHRFFTKSKRVLDFWFSFLALSSLENGVNVSYHGKVKRVISKKVSINQNEDEVMLVRDRLSRIYYKGKLFSYPLKINFQTIRQIGFIESVLILQSYLYAEVFPRKPEISLEDFFINRFGSRLYKTFFKTYTEKVWGFDAAKIPALWGAQRVKGLSIKKALLESLKQTKTETSLIERFLYPKLGPGQLWESVAKHTKKNGGKVKLNCSVTKISCIKGGRFVVEYVSNGRKATVTADYVFSTMPVKALAKSLSPPPPKEILAVSSGLEYRDFVVVGIVLNKLSSPLKDTWLYIHDKNVAVGRIQIFNNWSPALVAKADTVWIGMEYFCNKGDAFWKQTDKNILKLAMKELVRLKLAAKQDYIDGTVVRVPKAYPAYTGGFSEFGKVRKFFDSIDNLYLIGRNGMHKYNNQDHSMLTAMTAVDNIIKNRLDKSNIWEVNTEENYHEEK